MRKPWEIVQYFKTLPRQSPIRKTILLEEAAENNVPLFEGFNLAFNQTIMFGLTKIPDPYKGGPGLPHSVFMEHAIEIANISSRNKKYKQIEKLYNLATLEEWFNWYKPIITKSLKCGVNRFMITKWIGKDYPEFAIEDFACQLTYNKKVDLNIINGIQIIEPAMGGYRNLLTVYPSGRCELVSSIGLDCGRCYPHIISQFEKLAHTLGEPIVFDGWLNDNSKKILFADRGNRPRLDAEFIIFDIIPLSYFSKRLYNIPLLQRKEVLHNWFTRNPQLTQIKEIEYKIVDFSTTQGREDFKQIANDFVEAGNLYVIVKAGNSPYDCRVTMKWIMHRPQIILKMEITTLEEHQDHSGMMHIMRCKGTYNHQPITAKVNVGFTMDQRYEFLTNWDKVIGSIAKIYAPIIKKKVGGYIIENASFIELEETK